MKYTPEWFEEFRRLNPERWWWKYQRGAVRVLDFFRYDTHQGVRNLIMFFPVVWRWRGWSHEYDYDVFMRAIELHRRSLLKFHHHEHWEREAAGMDLTLRRWDYILNGWEQEEDILVGADNEQRVWRLMHDHLKRNAQKWWE